MNNNDTKNTEFINLHLLKADGYKAVTLESLINFLSHCPDLIYKENILKEFIRVQAESFKNDK